MPSPKELKYLSKILGGEAPLVGVEDTSEEEAREELVELSAVKLNSVVEAINNLGLGIAISFDDENNMYIGKGTKEGNYYIIFNFLEKSYACAFVNQSTQQHDIKECKTALDAVKVFKEKTSKK